MSSRAIQLAPDEVAAARPVRELEARLGRIGANLAHMAGSDAAHAALAGPMGRFLDSRRRLVALYRARGLAAARAHMLQADFLAAREAVQEVLRRDAGCLPPGDRAAAPEVAGGGRPSALTDGPMRRALPSPGERTGEAALHGAPAVPRFWLGIAVIAALCLLLVAYLVFDSAERREDARFGCHLPARLRTREGDQRVVVVEISRGGAKLRTAARFVVGERGVLVLLGAPIAFKVVWATPSFCGICFRRKLDVSNEQLARLSAGEPRPDPLAPALAAE